jgi:hypothetical protein
MPFNLHPKTLHEKLIAKDFEVEAALPINNFKKSLVNLINDYTKGKYTEIKIIPGDKVMENDEWKLKDNFYFFYVKDNLDHHEYNPLNIRIIYKTFVNTNTGNEKEFSLNHMVY